MIYYYRYQVMSYDEEDVLAYLRDNELFNYRDEIGGLYDLDDLLEYCKEWDSKIEDLPNDFGIDISKFFKEDTDGV